ncbi:MAG: fibronectin type III domain-containing protein, partial [Clostridia bacterium]|nr:fibronectin type III domain-containing protein [Clostridia bacterium]
MQFNWKKRLGAMLLTVFVIVGTVAAFPVFAADNIEIILEDVTASDPTTLSGEAKISVSVKGAVGSVTLVQTALKFSGNAKYKSIEFKQGKNDPGDGYFQIAPNAALVNSTGKLLPGIVAIKEPAMTFTDEKTEVFVLTFVGEPGETVVVGFDTEGKSYCTVDQNELPVQGADVSCEAETSLDANEGIEAVVQLEMNKIKDFNTASDGDYADSKITLTITNETSGTTISTVLNNIPIKKGGHRDGGASIPTFIVKNTVISGDTYTVELMGPGYVSYKTTDYSFDRALELDNDDFIPGNVNMDEKVDDADKAAFKEVLGGNYENYGKDNADFNRSGEVNEFDNIFGNLDDVEEEPAKNVPEKMKKPTVSGGSGSITVKWEAPQNGGSEITGYVIKYGTSKNDLDKEVEIEGKSTKSKTITKLNDGKTYYVSIAAVNSIGTGEFSDVANAKTEDADDNGG